jgi:hypothetical protein
VSEYGYTAISYLSSGLKVSELKDDGYYEVTDGADTVCISAEALRILAEFAEKEFDGER